MIYLLLELKFICESDNGIESKFQCQINHGLERNVEFDSHTNPLQAFF